MKRHAYHSTCAIALSHLHRIQVHMPGRDIIRTRPWANAWSAVYSIVFRAVVLPTLISRTRDRACKGQNEYC